MRKNIFFIIIIIILLSLKLTNDTTYIKRKEEIGYINIPKIKLNRPLYPINSKENTIEKNIAILKESIMPNENNSILILAAHSGTGKIAYFEQLDQLTINDEIIINYHNKNYIYQVKDIWEEKKNGFININKELKKQLVLTTCSPKKDNTQLIINCTIKES